MDIPSNMIQCLGSFAAGGQFPPHLVPRVRQLFAEDSSRPDRVHWTRCLGCKADYDRVRNQIIAINSSIKVQYVTRLRAWARQELGRDASDSDAVTELIRRHTPRNSYATEDEE